MRKIIDKEKVKEFSVMSYIFLAEMLIVAISAYPLFSMDGYIGIIIWILFFAITFGTATIIEKLKKRIMTFRLIRKLFHLLMENN